MTVSAQEGSPFSLRCQPPDGWPKPSVYWMMQNTNGALRSINSSRMTVDPEGTLWFSNVTRDDTSDDFVYACSATSLFRYRTPQKYGLTCVCLYLRHAHSFHPSQPPPPVPSQPQLSVGLNSTYGPPQNAPLLFSSRCNLIPFPGCDVTPYGYSVRSTHDVVSSLCFYTHVCGWRRISRVCMPFRNGWHRHSLTER